MNGSFSPHLSILPAVQGQLWEKLAPAGELGFVLYGGTAIALRLGHRISVDFDFFSEKPLDRESIRRHFPFLADARLVQEERETLSYLVGDREGQQPVKLSFFGGIDFGRVGVPEWTQDHVLRVASLRDLMATKLKVILQRAEAKDYRDIQAMLQAGESLASGLGAARALFGNQFQPAESLKALVYFRDGDLETLSAEEKNALVVAVRGVTDIPEAYVISGKLAL